MTELLLGIAVGIPAVCLVGVLLGRLYRFGLDEGIVADKKQNMKKEGEKMKCESVYRTGSEAVDKLRSADIPALPLKLGQKLYDRDGNSYVVCGAAYVGGCWYVIDGLGDRYLVGGEDCLIKRKEEI